jgi:hypothetical protein
VCIGIIGFLYEMNQVDVFTVHQHGQYVKGPVTQKASCRGVQAAAGNRDGPRFGDAGQSAAAKSGPV